MARKKKGKEGTLSPLDKAPEQIRKAVEDYRAAVRAYGRVREAMQKEEENIDETFVELVLLRAEKKPTPDGLALRHNVALYNIESLKRILEDRADDVYAMRKQMWAAVYEYRGVEVVS